MDVRTLAGRVGVVTGAASGIGRATALEMAGRGADLAICDVDAGGLKETADRAEQIGRRVHTRVVDVARAEEVQRFADETYEVLGRADLVVNNAGIGVGGAMLDVPLEEFRRVVEIDLMGVVHGCYAFLPRMVEAGRPAHVVNIASMAGYVASPGMTSYTAAKFGVVGFSEALRAELSDRGIGVTAICPGVIDTPIVRAARNYGPGATEETRERAARMFQKRGYGPDRVARNLMKAVQRNRGVAPISPEAWAGYYVKRFAPWLLALLARSGARRARERGEL